MRVLEGKSVFSGIAIGKISILQKADTSVKRTKVENPEAEITRVQEAKEKAVEQLQKLYDKALREVGESGAAIFEVHQMMLDDEDYLDSIDNIIRTENVNAEYAVATTGDNFADMFAQDEATSALDPQTTSSILELLKKINKQFGITIVIITHQMSVVREICTHVAIMYEGEVVEKGLVADIFANPQSEVAKELIRKDTGSDIDADSRLDAVREKGQAEIKSGEKIRIVFSENSAFEPVIANLILTFGEPVNILKADTKNVGGVAKGEMILEFMEGSTRTEMMKQYLKEKGLAIGEVTEYVGS